MSDEKVEEKAIEVKVDQTTAKCFFLIRNLMDEILNKMRVRMPDKDKTFEDGYKIGYNAGLDKVFYRLNDVLKDIDGYLGYTSGFNKIDKEDNVYGKSSD